MTQTDFGSDGQEWITLDVLCLFCRSNNLAIRFGSAEKQDWVSPFGVASQGDTLEVADQLRQSLNFEVYSMNPGKEVRYFVTRQELEQQLRRIMN